jgi:hypothetical protein
MITDRETIYAALFDLMNQLPGGFTTSGRRLRHWADVRPDEQPAAFQQQVSEEATVPVVRGIPQKWNLHANWWIYCWCEQYPDGVPSTQINQYLDYVDKAIPSGGTQVLTLGLEGVSEVRIVGTIKTDEGLLGNQGVAIIPIRIVAV